MNEKVSKAINLIIGILILAVVAYILYVTVGYTRKLANLETTLERSRDTVVELRERIEQQESLIESITIRQSELEDVSGRLTDELQRTKLSFDRATVTLDNLIGVEQDIDGYTGAVRGTVDEVIRTIDVTIQGIREEGITDEVGEP